MNKSRSTSTLFGHPCRRSVQDRPPYRRTRSIFSDSSSGVSHSEPVDSDDYSDVFGGPPKSLLVHKCSSSGSLYEGIFRLPEFTPSVEKSDLSLPVFRIPVRNEGFFNDIFGSDDDRKSRERSGSLSKANSSSALSSEELSPCRPTMGEEVPLSPFASKLRPTSVPLKWNSSAMVSEDYPSKQGVSFFSCNDHSFGVQHEDNEYKSNFKSSPHGFSKLVSSPATTSLGSDSYQGVKVFADDWELNSPSESKCSVYDPVLSEQIEQQDDDGESDDDYSDDDDVMSSYVIEINSSLRREDCEASDIDEAIAWAKEKFQSRSPDEKSRGRNYGNEQTVKIQGSPDASEYHDYGIGKVQPPKQKQQTQTEKLDEDIRMWSSGKETDIRLLLSTLHHILWPESGWKTIPLVSLMEKSQVKRAYQKARLCLHPDKLQQKGATLLHKYVAEQAFSILQDAWAAFISENVSF